MNTFPLARKVHQWKRKIKKRFLLRLLLLLFNSMNFNQENGTEIKSDVKAFCLFSFVSHFFHSFLIVSFIEYYEKFSLSKYWKLCNHSLVPLVAFETQNSEYCIRTYIKTFQVRCSISVNADFWSILYVYVTRCYNLQYT